MGTEEGQNFASASSGLLWYGLFVQTHLSASFSSLVIRWKKSGKQCLELTEEEEWMVSEDSGQKTPRYLRPVREELRQDSKM